MRKLDRTLRDMKRESIWDPPPDAASLFLLDQVAPGPTSPFSADRQQALSGQAILGRPSSLLRQELGRELRKDWDAGWGPSFGTDFISQFMEGDPMPRGAQTGSLQSAPTFSYSQKNFHSADGNLYSIFTPFQARKSTSKPSFFRGPTTVVGEPKKSASEGNNLAYEMPSISVEGSSSQHGGSTRSSRSRRGKLKFHNQDVPPQYRTNPASSEGSSATSEAGSTSADHSHTSSSRINMSSSSFSSSYAKSHSRFSESSKESFYGRSTSMDDSDPFDIDNFFSRRSAKRDDLFERTSKRDDLFERSSKREDLFERSSKRNDPFEVLDLSKPRKDLFEKDWDRFDELRSAHRLRKSRMRKSIFEDSDHEDEDEPLNLCIADNLIKQRKKDVPQKVKREPVDSDSDITPAQSPFSAARERFERKHRNLFANRSPGPSIFRSPSPDIPRTAGGTSSVSHESTYDFMEDDEALDLSFKQNQRSEFKSRFREKSSFSDETKTSRQSEEGATKQRTGKAKKVPIISELLESMSIWDECTRSPQPPEPHTDNVTTVNVDEGRQQQHTRCTNTTAFPSWGTKERHVEDTGNVKETVSKENCDLIKPSSVCKPTPVPESLSAVTECVASGTDSCRTELTNPQETNERLPNPNYYLLVPTTFVPTYGLNPVFVSSQQLPTPANPSEPCKSEKLTIRIPCMKSKSSDEVPETPVTADFISTARIEVKPKIPKVTVATCFSPKPARASGNRQQKRQALDSSQARSSSEPPTNNDISICKFKLIKGDQPMLEEKKSYFVPLPRNSRVPSTEIQRSASASSATTSGATATAGPSTATGAAPKQERFRTYKIHVGSQEELGRKLAAGKKTRRRSRKALVREKLEATFREQGFLIKTQQVASAEGAVYCKFRQLKKFTRYLFKSWRDYLPKDLEDMPSSSSLNALIDPNLHQLAKATLSLPDIPSTAMYSPATSRSSSMSGTSGLGTSILTDSGTADTAHFANDAGSVASLSTNDDGSMMTDATNMSDTYTFPGVSPCPSTSSQPCASPSSSSIT